MFLKMEQIYVLQCQSGKYYIGKTTDVMRRFNDHKIGKGSAWTNKYKPTKMLECRTLTGEHAENNTTKDYMKKYGIENVRGGSYSQIQLPKEVVSLLEREIRGNSDVCYNCNKLGHFINECTETEDEWCCEYCDRTFTTHFGAMVHERSCRKVDACYKCGREGHRSPSCYAKTHIDGYYI